MSSGWKKWFDPLVIGITEYCQYPIHSDELWTLQHVMQMTNGITLSNPDDIKSFELGMS